MSSKSHFFNRGLRLLADYQFNNNLIDDANGYNLTGTDITYNNGSAVFNGTTSEARRTDTNDIFSFTDGVKDLPFRIEISLKLSKLGDLPWLISKQLDINNKEWFITYNVGNSSAFRILLFDSIGSRIFKECVIIPSLSTTYNIIITYNGLSLSGLNINVNGIDGVVESDNGYTKMHKTGADLIIGRNATNPQTVQRFNGQIDYLKIYK